MADSRGMGHIACAVDDVKEAREAVLSAGGGIGEVMTLQTTDGRPVIWCHVADPEGNILELQSWEPAT